MSFFQKLKESAAKIVDVVELSDGQMKARANAHYLRQEIRKGLSSGNRCSSMISRLPEVESLSPKGAINDARALFTKLNRIRQGLANTIKML